MKQYIQLRGKEKREKIAKTFNISLANVSQILNYKREGPKAESVRKMAEDLGGIRMSGNDMPKQTKVLDSKGNVKEIITN